MSQHRIIELSVKQIRGTLTSEEAIELEELRSGASSDTLVAVEKAIEHERRLVRVLRLMQLARPNFEANRQRVVYPAHENKGVLKRIWAVPRLQRFVSVAAVVFALMAGVLVWRKFSTKTPGTSLTAQADQLSLIKPVSNRAMLVLADGSSVVLDSAADGKIATQGATTITKDADGKLSYQPGTNIAAVGFNTISTPLGGQYFVELPDRTRVWLNAASSIKFPTAFTSSEREVTITGEAYLEVAKDTKHPFIVTTGETNVRVLGTHFNVKNYAEDGPAHTTLLEGSVRVRAYGREVTIKPGQGAISDPKAMVVDEKVDTAKVVAWKNGFLSFADADITTIMNIIKRWYDVDVVYDGEKSLYKIQGTIPKSSSIDDVLKMLEIAGYRFSIKGKTIHVLSR